LAVRKPTLTLLVTLAVLCSVVFLGSSRAVAIPKFKSAFAKEYVNKEKNPEFAELVKKTSCWLCHNYDPENPKKKEKRNRYGSELSKLLDKKKDKKDVKKMAEAFKQVAQLHVDPKDKKSPTYGELIKQGKLPGGKPVMPPKKEKL
jgi:hypothetical protein